MSNPDMHHSKRKRCINQSGGRNTQKVPGPEMLISTTVDTNGIYHIDSANY